MRRFVEIGLAAAIVLAARTGGLAQGSELRYGVAAFGEVDPLRDLSTVASCGYDYIEPALSKTLALTADARQDAKRQLDDSRIRVETANWFLPGTEIKLTGPSVDQARVRAYLEDSLALAEQLGVKVVVFGSPGARSFPEGFARDQAWKQLQDFLRQAADVIERHRYGMVIGIEALRKPETNIINSVKEAARLARDVDRQSIRIIVDFYHLAFENEDPDVVLQARDLIVHLQIADPKERGFPKTDEGEPRYARFFQNLRTIGYKGRISIEANSSNLAADCGPALAFLKQMHAKYGR